MDLERFTAEISYEVNERLSEITKLYNLQKILNDAGTQNAVRRSSICLYYAHVEGFVYFVFSHYIRAINGSNLRAKDVVDEIKAASYYADLMKLFSNKKHEFFRRCLPDDKHLHSLYRQVEFFADIAPLWGDATISINEKFIDTENNVGKEVLQKLLYKVGLDYNGIDSSLYSNLSQLLSLRNDIAHGQNLSLIRSDKFEEYYRCSKKIISELEGIIIAAYAERKFLAPTEE